MGEKGNGRVPGDARVQFFCQSHGFGISKGFPDGGLGSQFFHRDHLSVKISQVNDKKVVVLRKENLQNFRTEMLQGRVLYFRES